MSATIRVGRVDVEFTLARDEQLEPLRDQDGVVVGYAAWWDTGAPGPNRFVLFGNYGSYEAAARALYVERPSFSAAHGA